MQANGTILWKVKTDFLGPFRWSSIVALIILFVMIFSILPALASEAFATDPAEGAPNRSAKAVASAQVIKPYTMTSTSQTGTKAYDSATTVTHKTTYRDCTILLGTDSNQATGTSCELRLIELQ